MDGFVEVCVLEARRRNPEWGPRRLVNEAVRAGIEPAPSRSGVYRALKRADLIDRLSGWTPRTAPNRRARP
jgi:hypothetical protein